MKRIKEDKLFSCCVTEILVRDDNYEHFDAFANSFSKEEINAINIGLSEFLAQNRITGDVVADEVVISTNENDYKSIIFSTKENGKTQSIAIFSIKNFFIESWISWIGIAVSVVKHENMAVSIAEMVKKAYDNFNRLKKPEDSDCIDLLEEIIRLKALNKAANRTIYPKMQELRASLTNMNGTKFQEAFKKLIELNAIEVKVWGGQKSNLKHPDNQISIQL